MINRMYNRVKKYLLYPRIVSIDDLVIPPIQFRVRSDVERYRTEDFGGERAALEKFLDILEPEDIIYDVGASVGLFAIAAAVKAPNGKVVAFEPDPETSQRLRENVALNELENVQTVDWAASDSSGTVELYTDGAAGFAPTMRPQNREGAPKSTVEIETRTIDDALANGNLPHPDVMKVDIEGAEALCLRGSEELLNGVFGPPPRALFVEVHPQFLRDYDSTEDEVRRRIREAGYDVVWSRDREEQRHLFFLKD